jgi:hypothetical protein
MSSLHTLPMQLSRSSERTPRANLRREPAWPCSRNRKALAAAKSRERLIAVRMVDCSPPAVISAMAGLSPFPLWSRGFTAVYFVLRHSAAHGIIHRAAVLAATKTPF